MGEVRAARAAAGCGGPLFGEGEDKRRMRVLEESNKELVEAHKLLVKKLEAETALKKEQDERVAERNE